MRFHHNLKAMRPENHDSVAAAIPASPQPIRAYEKSRCLLEETLQGFTVEALWPFECLEEFIDL